MVNWGYRDNFKLFNFLFHKKISQAQEAQKRKQATFLPLDVFMRIKMLPFCFFVCLFAFCLLKIFFFKKTEKFETALIPWVTYTTYAYPSEPTYRALIYTHLFLFVIICNNLFLFMRIFLNLFLFMKIFLKLFFLWESCENIFLFMRTYFFKSLWK